MILQQNTIVMKPVGNIWFNIWLFCLSLLPAGQQSKVLWQEYTTNDRC